MKPKEPHLIITFYTTAEAMAMEQLCQSRGIPGKLISAPRSLSADCGIAWSAPLSAREQLEQAIQQAQLEIDGIHELPA